MDTGRVTVLHEAMSLFQELFRNVDPPSGDTFPPDRQSERFPATVARSRRLHLFVRGQPASSTGRYLLIGIATWSDYDMKLLDRVDALSGDDLRVDVFDSDTFHSAEEIEALIPGINVWRRLLSSVIGWMGY